jgi:cbb3-type cytochrome oxidase maturation protein
VEVIAIALPVAMGLSALALWACVRAIKAGQFDDLDTPALRMLADDEEASPKS